MDENVARTKSEKFLPCAPQSLEGARANMAFLTTSTSIEVGVPLHSQIFSLLQGAPRGGYKVVEVASALCLNTKTCAKVLDEMVFKYEDMQVTAHRYGRVFLHKYQIRCRSEEIEEPVISEALLNELDSLPALDKETVENALAFDQHTNRRLANRQRVTHQTLVRALYILKKVRDAAVIPVNELKQMISRDLEPGAEWTLDRKTVIRIISKLQNVGLLKLLVFSVSYGVDEGTKVNFVGTSLDTKNKDEHIIHKILVALPEVSEDDSLVRDNPVLTNPKHSKPISLPANAVNKQRSKAIANYLAKLFAVKEEKTSKFQQISIWMDDLAERIVLRKMKDFWKELSVPETCRALKYILNKSNSVFAHRLDKLRTAYQGFTIQEKTERNYAKEVIDPPELNVYLPKKRSKKKRHPTESEASHAVRRIILAMENNPENISIAKDKFLNKGLDVSLEHLMDYLELLDIAHLKKNTWNLNMYYSPN